jgi:hypothetical protein
MLRPSSEELGGVPWHVIPVHEGMTKALYAGFFGATAQKLESRPRSQVRRKAWLNH